MEPQRPRTIIGIALMLGAMAVLPFLDVVAKTLGNQGMPILQIVWARMAFGALLTLPFTLRHGGAAAIRPDRPAYHTLRAALLIAATFLFFSALKYLPIADALAIFFVQPLILTAISPFLLGERVGPRRWAAVAVGFIGTLIIIRPGAEVFTLAALLPLANAVAYAGNALLTRHIGMKEPFWTSLMYGALFGAVVGGIALPFVWVTPTLPDLGLFFLVGCLGTAAQLCIIRSFSTTEASVVAPFTYLGILFSTLWSVLFFNDWPDGWTIVGALVIVGAGLYVWHRETLHARQSQTRSDD